MRNIIKRMCTVRMNWLVLPALLVALPAFVAAQQDYPPEDTTEAYWDEYDEYYEDEDYGEYEEEEYFEDEYSGQEDEYYEDEYYEDEYYEDEYYEEDDAYFDEEYDEYYEDEFIEEEGPLEEEGERLDLADDQAGEVELAEIEKPKIKPPRVIRGYTAKVSVVSPYMVGLGFDSWWYSWIDARLSLDFPKKAGSGALAPTYTVELATFSFDNQHPSGGKFSGVALQGLMRIPVGPVKATVGGGLFVSQGGLKGGMLFAAGYSIPFLRYIDFTAESRLTFVQGAVAPDHAYWLDVGGSIGFRF